MEIHHSGNIYSSQEQKVLETFNTRLNSHSLHKGSYRTKQNHEEATASEKLCSFSKEEFERLFGVGGVWMVLALVRASVLSLVS